MDINQSVFEGLFTGENKCKLCGYVSQLGAIETHHVVPRELTSQANLPDSTTVALCSNCHREVHSWYSKKVFDMTYDTTTKRFRPKSLTEMVKEYEAAYRVFAEYKKGQRKRA